MFCLLAACLACLTSGFADDAGSGCTDDLQAGEQAVSILQLGVSLKGKNLMLSDLMKPWDKHLYVVGVHHKAGTQALRNIMRRSFDTLGANYSCRESGGQLNSTITSIGGTHMEVNHEVVNKCSEEPDCPIHFIQNGEFDFSHLLADRQLAGEKGMRAVTIIRDPLQMVASAYCYHHAGNEMGSPYAPVNVMQLNAQEGVPPTAEAMLGNIMNMVGIYKVSDSRDTHIVRYEDLTRSSSDFDSTVASMFDFLFEDMITPKEREQIEIEARKEDLNRGRDGYSPENHISDEGCKEQATASLQLIPADLYSQYQEYRAVLGYI